MATIINNYTYISNKIRRVTGRPSATQITDEDIRGYINSFLVYDLPLHNRFFYQKERFSMILTPDVGTYPITAFKNTYSNFMKPCYIDGYEIQYYQDDQSFNQMFSRLKYTTQLSTGTGVAGPYNGNYSYTPIETETAVISTVDAAGNALNATDNGAGTFVGNVLAGSVINYDTGVITGITWTAVIGVGEPIYISANQYIRGRPLAMLYFNDNFFFWPFPDKSYTFSIDAYRNPVEYLFGGGAAFPELNQWADAIAFGTSLKIFQDNMDLESYQKTYPFFDLAKRLAARRSLTQLSTQRVATIYGDNEIWPWQNGYPMI